MAEDADRTVLLIGALDTKGEEYAFVRDLLATRGCQALVVNIGVMGEPRFLVPQIGADAVAAKAGETLESLRRREDRGWAMTVMSRGASRLVRELHDSGRFAGVLGMGGTGGTSVISAAMRELPVGVPKVLVSTVASGDTREIVGLRDIVLIPSVVDVAGVNRVSRRIFEEAAGAIAGMVQTVTTPSADSGRATVAVSMFGNTTPCVDRCRATLENRGFEVLIFHSTGTGGRTLENLVDDGMIAAVLDITTTEWADELCGGVFSAGPHRLEAPGRKGIPHVIVPGCIDMVNFGASGSVPDRYRGRLLSVWNPQVTLMRTTPAENEEMGRIFAGKANEAKGPAAFLIPRSGFSILDSPGHEFWQPEADAAFLAALKSGLSPEVPVYEMDTNINDPAFADRAVELLLRLMSAKS